jgi:hypothetical protein
MYDRAGVLKLTRTSYKSTIEALNKEGKDVVVTYSAL